MKSVGKRKTPASSGETRMIKPAETPEAREDQLISLAYDLVQQRLLDGTATSQETTHFLKLGSRRARLEATKIERENELLKAKTEMVKSGQVSEELYREAIEAFKTYSGQPAVEDEEDD